jgi:hypothetical protein
LQWNCKDEGKKYRKEDNKAIKAGGWPSTAVFSWAPDRGRGGGGEHRLAHQKGKKGVGRARFMGPCRALERRTSGLTNQSKPRKAMAAMTGLIHAGSWKHGQASRIRRQ